jgi:hypothetical protein
MFFQGGFGTEFALTKFQAYPLAPMHLLLV